ncbi:HIT-like protein [Schizophyllum commune H4-8]|uniref:Scavenger mRNA decapping enzyme n=1 Tax=Schizophyllum commune (strain H4-8 / FGSC 9210) TaxID=578458 RepID=D8QE80_SCHCM|nr:HIT-like protein [Schizophyllum commune H4-8]KAI5888407.1 HIT-like protein [Schizophyllum commune H4-8]
MTSTDQKRRDTLARLPHFELTRVLDEDPGSKSAILLGTLPAVVDGETTPSTDTVRQLAIITLSKTHIPSSVLSEGQPLFAPAAGEAISPALASIDIGTLLVEESTDIYTWMFASFADDKAGSHKYRDVKITLIFPATEAHIRKYTRQKYTMVRETPETYANIVEPYISSIPKSRTQWVLDILEGRAEQEKVLYNCPDFILVPDMKWDLTTISSIYICAIARVEGLRSLRDLRGEHIPLLKGIQREATRVVAEKWPAVGAGGLRMFIHYQPTYYHFHVHIVNVNGGELIARMAIGTAHLLDDVISMLEVQPDIYARTTLTYSLGDQHGLYTALLAVA